MENYIFFKNENGVLYGVPPRVMATGYRPSEGHVLATEEEKAIFIDHVIVKSPQELVEVEELPIKILQNLPVNFVVPRKTSQNLSVNFAEESKPKPTVLSPEEVVVGELPIKILQNLPVNFVVPRKTSQNLSVNFAEESKPKPTVSPIEQRRQAFFETLPEEEVSFYGGLSNQGLSPDQLYKVKVVRDSKTIERKVN